jgi:hypothetical protein
LGSQVKREYAIKQVGDHYYPVIIDREAGGHYGILSYKTPEAAETYVKRTREKGRNDHPTGVKGRAGLS